MCHRGDRVPRSGGQLVRLGLAAGLAVGRTALDLVNLSLPSGRARPAAGKTAYQPSGTAGLAGELGGVGDGSGTFHNPR
jgi:hypothetical protein